MISHGIDDMSHSIVLVQRFKIFRREKITLRCVVIRYNSNEFVLKLNSPHRFGRDEAIIVRAKKSTDSEVGKEMVELNL